MGYGMVIAEDDFEDDEDEDLNFRPAPGGQGCYCPCCQRWVEIDFYGDELHDAVSHHSYLADLIEYGTLH